jgi:hypothetical protein
MPVDAGFRLPPELALEQIITLAEAEEVSSLSADSWKRHHRDKLIELSPKRLGVRLRDALLLRRKRPP